MKHVSKTSLLASLATIGGAFHAAADPVEAFFDDSFAVLEESVPGKFSIDARLRYELFDLEGSGSLADGGPNDRDGSSLRVRYGYLTPVFSGFSAMVEGETVTRLGGDPADIHFLDNLGDGTDLNQLWVRYADADYGQVKVGRQIYALDDHRFIGHVGWRQNIQTFDAATVEFSGVEKLSLKGFYLAEQHAVNGSHNELDALGANASYAFGEGFQLTGFAYDIEGDEAGNAAISNRTLGMRATGSFKVAEIGFSYAASLAAQEDSGPSPLDYEADYMAADLAGTFGDNTLGAGFEIFEPMFRTPLSTVHKFNGFADVFLPLTGFAQGLEDYYVYAGYTIPLGNGIQAKAIYHWFEPESGAGDYGEEFDLVASYRINDYLNLVGKYGDYDSDGGAGGVGGTDKTMFTLELNFVY